jgi:hypothetical protein
MIPEDFSEVFASLEGKDCFRIDIETPTTQVEFKLQNQY